MMRQGKQTQDFLLEKIKEKKHSGTVKELFFTLSGELFYECPFLERGKPKKKSIYLLQTEKSFRRALDGLVKRGLLRRQKAGYLNAFEYVV